MTSRTVRRASYAILAGLAAVLSFAGCARRLHYPTQQPSIEATAEVWQEPQDLETRDLFYGPGGPELVPDDATYSFVARKTNGTNPGYDVRDSKGRLWSVKLGEEAQSGVTASRILWAIGFYQPPTYYVPRWTLSGADRPQQPAGRFRTELPGHEATGDWSWYHNPFIGSRALAALVTVNLMLSNWDFKTSNNRIYTVTLADGTTERRYVVRDVGATLGKAKQPRPLNWFPLVRQKQGSKNDLHDFETHGFVKDDSGEFVKFDYRGSTVRWSEA